MLKSIIQSSSDDNLYKYLIIIGLSLFLIYPIINNDLKEKHLKIIEISYDLKKEEKNVKYLQTKLISEIKNFDGKDIYTLDDVEKIIISSKEILDLLPQDIKHINKESKEYESIEESIRKICIAFQIKFKGEIFNEDFFNQLDIVEEKFINLEKEYLEVGNRLDQIDLDFKKVELEIEYINQQKKTETIIKIIGILLIIIGIINWYIKIQRYNDIDVKRNRLIRIAKRK